MPDAAVAAWLLGAGADLMTIERPGLLAGSYLLAAVAVASLREYFFRLRGVTQFGMTLATGLVVQLGWCSYRWVMYDAGRPVIADIAIDIFLAPIYTALWAPPVHAGLLAVSPLLGINRPQYTYAGLSRMRDAGV
jgi:hypothetical protein